MPDAKSVVPAGIDAVVRAFAPVANAVANKVGVDGSSTKILWLRAGGSVLFTGGSMMVVDAPRRVVPRGVKVGGFALDAAFTFAKKLSNRLCLESVPSVFLTLVDPWVRLDKAESRC